MHWTLSPWRWNDGCGPPGSGFHRRPPRPERRQDPRGHEFEECGSSGRRSTQRSIGPSSLWIRHGPASHSKGHPPRISRENFIGAQAGLEDRIVGGFDAGREAAGIEADALSVRFLVFGRSRSACRMPIATRSRVPGQGLVQSSSASPSSPMVIISMNRAGHRSQAAFEFVEDIFVARYVGRPRCCERRPPAARKTGPGRRTPSGAVTQNVWTA